MTATSPSKGHVLVHVLITAVIIAIISAGIARMLLARYTLLSRSTVGSQGRASDIGGVNRVLTLWAQNGIACSDASSVGYTCSPLSVVRPGNTNCKCCPKDTNNDAAMIFVGGVRLCVETPSQAMSGGSGGYQADNSSGLTPACVNISCP